MADTRRRPGQRRRDLTPAGTIIADLFSTRTTTYRPADGRDQEKGTTVLQTEDLYLGAYAILRGGQLVRVDVSRQNGRRLAVLVIEGASIDECEAEYWRGSAVVNLLHLKSQLRRLKDRAFMALRDEERRRDATGDEGRYRTGSSGEPHRWTHR